MGLCAAVLVMLLGRAAAESAAGGVSLTNVSIGYNGLMTYSRPMPVRASLENNGADRSGVLAVNVYVSAQEYDRYELPLTLAAGSRRQVTLPVRVYYRQASYTVEWVENGQTASSVTISPTRTADPSVLLAGILTSEPSSLYYLNITKDNDTLYRGEYWQTVPLTASTFPEDETLLSAFDFLIVDQFDASSLSTRQMDALEKWVRSGGVLVLGGGADAGQVYPAFYDWMGIAPGKVKEGGDITPALSAYLKVTEQAAGKAALLTEAKGGNALIMDGETPLLFRSALGGGMIYTAAFSWSDPALSSWKLMHSFLQRLFIQDIPVLYESHANDWAWNEGEYWDAESFARSAAVPNSTSAVPMLLILAAYLIVGGVGGYFLLKKLDKREWLWGLFPALTALCVASIALLSKAGGYGSPMAVTFTHYNLDEGAAVTAYAAVTVNDGEEHKLSAGDRDLRLINTYSYYYYDDSEEGKPAVPSRLRYRYGCGAQKAVSLSFQAPWTVIPAKVSAEMPEMDIQADVHPTETGLKGTVRNNSDCPLRDCVVLTSFGFCSIPDLGPGESAEFALNEKADNKNKLFTDGVYVPDSTDRYYYSILSAYVYPEEQLNVPYQLSWEERQKREAMCTLLDNAFSDVFSGAYSDGLTFFRFFAFNDELNPAQLYVDGQPVERVAHRCVVSTALRYDPKGENGAIYYAQGTLKASPASVDSSGTPSSGEGKLMSGSEYRLTDMPAFCFDIPEGQRITVSNVKISLPDYYYGVTALPYAYDFAARDWVEFNLDAAWDKSMLKNCIRDGRLYVRFLPPPGAESYFTISAPMLELEGKVI